MRTPQRQERLFDLAGDPFEAHNLRDSKPTKLDGLRRRTLELAQHYRGGVVQDAGARSPQGR